MVIIDKILFDSALSNFWENITIGTIIFKKIIYLDNMYLVTSLVGLSGLWNKYTFGTICFWDYHNIGSGKNRENW